MSDGLVSLRARRLHLVRIVAAVGVIVLALVGIQPVTVAHASTVALSGHIALGAAGTSAGANEVWIYAVALTGSDPDPNGTATDASGNFSIPYLTPGGSYYLWYHYVGTGNFSDQWSGNKSASTDLVPSDAVDVPSAATAIAPTIVLPHDATFSGHVDGGSLGNTVGAGAATISFTYSDPTDILNLAIFDHTHSVQTDANGNYSILLPASPWKVTFTSNDPAYYSTTGDQIEMGTVNQSLNKVLPPAGVVTGHVAVGNAATSATAGQVQISYDISPLGGGGQSFFNAGQTVTDDHGNYRFGSLREGVYTFRFTAIDGSNFQATSTQQTVTIDGPGETRTAPDVTMPAGTVIGGVVSLSGGGTAGAGAVSVSLWSDWSSNAASMTTTTDASGHYRFAGVPNGSYELDMKYVGSAGFASAWWTPQQDATHPCAVLGSEAGVVVAAGAPLAANISLPQGTTISGRVTTTSGGVPTSFAQIQVVRLDSSGAVIDTLDHLLPNQYLVTNADGTYSVGPVVPGRYQLNFISLGYNDTHAGATLGNPLENDTLTLTGGVVNGVNATEFLRGAVHLSPTCPNCRPNLAFAYTFGLQRLGSAGWEDVALTPFFPVANEWIGLFPGEYRAYYTSNMPPSATQYDDFTLAEGQVYSESPQLSEPVTLPSINGGVGDFDGDGLPDVIVRDAAGALWRVPSSAWTGPDPVPVKIATGWQGMTAIVSVGDFDGDGNPDLVARDGAGTVWLYPGNGSNGFKARVQIASGWASMTAIEGVGDFNDDGYRDLAVRDRLGTLWLYPGNGSGGLGVRQFMSTALSAMTSIIGVGDFDGDWEADILARDSNGDLWFYPGDGTGGLGDPVDIGDGWSGIAIAGLGDYDLDGTQDIVALDADGNLVVYPTGTGATQPEPVLLESGLTHYTLVGDGVTTAAPIFHNLPAPVTLPHVPAAAATTSIPSAPVLNSSAVTDYISPTDITRLKQLTQLDPRISKH